MNDALMQRQPFMTVVGLILGGCAAGLLAAPAPAPGGANPLTASPSPEEAMRNYRQGRFEQSEDQYSALARERPEDARLRFNAGAAAYRRNDLTNAARWFESVVSAPDLELQQQAYYNLGNTRYRLGEGATEPQGKQRLWQEALTNFTAASKLDAADAQAAGNLAFIRQKLQELQEQTPPPPQQQQKSDNKDQNSEKDTSKPQDSDQGKSQQEDNPSASDQQKSSEQSSGESQDADSKPKDDPGESKGEEAGKDGTGKPEENQPAGDGGAESKGRQGGGEESSGDGAGGEAASAGDPAPREMTRAQAIQVLEGQKGDEKALMLRSHGGNKQSERAARVRKPW
ncbi:MAG: tetratricopeptide repeat protein [Verrucomicrobia bacterium]|nr:tetratricopeptide repeat protein [Verrucomicrobiota bacterium]